MASYSNKEVSNLSTTGELVVDTAARVPSPTLAVRRPIDESRPEIPGRTLRSHSRGGRSSICAQEPPSQIGSFPICRTGSMDRATRPKKPRSEPEMLSDRPFPASVGRNPSPTPLETISSDTLSSWVPTDTSDEASASFHSTPDFHSQPQNPNFYTGSPHRSHQAEEFYTGPTPGGELQFYTGSNTQHKTPPTDPTTFYTVFASLHGLLHEYELHAVI